MRKWWKHLGATWKLLIEIATVGAAIFGGFTIYQAYRQHKDDQQQHERELAANLVQEGRPYQKDGYTHLLFRNTSPQGMAVISTVWFVINDQEQLAMIERVHPKPMPSAPTSGEASICGAMIQPEDAFFRNGQWHDDGEFVYSCYDPRQAQQMNGIVLKLAIFDGKLAGRKLNGIVVLNYNGEKQVESEPLSITCYREKQDSNPPAQPPPRQWKWFRPFRR
jgi:hypothetical protein